MTEWPYNHITPTEAARECGLERRDVLDKCVRLGVPIFQGRLDMRLFKERLAAAATGETPEREENR